ncbi:MAG: DinB family protein [Planctomycetota bacterium]
MSLKPQGLTACDGPLCGQLEVAQTDALRALSWEDLLRRFSVGVEWFDPRLFHLAEADMDLAFDPRAGCGRWPIRALAAHLADAEMVWLHRIRQAISEDRPMLGMFDYEAFIDGPLYGPGTRKDAVSPPVAGSIAVVHTLRRWTLDWLWDLAEGGRDRLALHPEHGELSVRGMLATTTWHLEHHADFLNRKIVHLAGPLPDPAEAVREPCGPACGCASRAAAPGATHDAGT